jgi:hypothetical protein
VIADSGGVQFTGTMPKGVTIAFGTDVWLEETPGEKLDLGYVLSSIPEARAANLDDGNCDACNTGFLNGMHCRMVEGSGVQRCDSCMVFVDDIEAAAVLARHLEKVLQHPHGTIKIWYIPSIPEEN